MDTTSKKTITNYFDQISLGMTGEFSKIINAEDLLDFSLVTGDNNPIHLDHDFAKNTIFGETISHGMLVAALISAVFGSIFPGPGWVYIRQSLEFKAPVFIGDKATARVVVVKLIEKKQMVEFETVVSVGIKTVINGKATLMAPTRPR